MAILTYVIGSDCLMCTDKKLVWVDTRDSVTRRTRVAAQMHKYAPKTTHNAHTCHITDCFMYKSKMFLFMNKLCTIVKLS